MSENKNVPKNEEDPELDDLLDSALEDLTKKEEPKEKKTDDGKKEDGEAPVMWSEEFMRESASQFESNMAAMLGAISGVPEDEITQEQIAATFTKMAEAAAHVLKPERTGAPPRAVPDLPQQERLNEFSSAISHTLQNLNSGSETLQAPFTADDVNNIFCNINRGEGGAEEANMFVPFMQGMMQSLLSKEVLYPSLMDMVAKYPAFLEANKGKIEESEYERFNSQLELMKEVCAVLEPEREDDSDDVKTKRFEVVLPLMHKMQDLGQPPTELVGDVGPPPPGMGAPLGDEAPQCCLM